MAYLPLSQNHETGMTLYVRSSVPPGTLAAPLRREIQQLEPNLPVPDIETMTETVGTSLYAARMGAWLLSAFGGLALLLAVVGIYGVLSFSMARRMREMGIRLALGAGTRQVFLLVVRDGMWLVGIGAAIGLGAAVVAARSVGAFLYGISPTDVPSFGGAVLALAAWRWSPARSRRGARSGRTRSRRCARSETREPYAPVPGARTARLTGLEHALEVRENHRPAAARVRILAGDHVARLRRVGELVGDGQGAHAVLAFGDLPRQPLVALGQSRRDPTADATSGRVCGADPIRPPRRR